MTKDTSIRYRTLEKLAYNAYGVRVFAFAQGSQKVERLAGGFIVALPEIERILAELEGPFIATVSVHGRVTVIDPPEKRTIR